MPKRKFDNKRLTSFFRTVGVRKFSWEKTKKLDEQAIEIIVKSKSTKKQSETRKKLTNLSESVPSIQVYEKYLSEQAKIKPVAQIARELNKNEDTISARLKYFGIKTLSASEAISIARSRQERMRYERREESDTKGPYIPKRERVAREQRFPANNINGIKPSPEEQKRRLEYAQMLSEKIMGEQGAESKKKKKK